MSTFKADYIIARQEEIAGNTSSIPVKTVVNGTPKAWVNFNGTGTISIRANFNVSSITDNGTGDYGINITNAISDANYCWTTNSSGDATYGSYGVYITPQAAPTTTILRLLTRNNAGTAADMIATNASINR